jgi:hypothetical protein
VICSGFRERQTCENNCARRSAHKYFPHGLNSFSRTPCNPRHAAISQAWKRVRRQYHRRGHQVSIPATTERDEFATTREH